MVLRIPPAPSLCRLLAKPASSRLSRHSLRPVLVPLSQYATAAAAPPSKDAPPADLPHTRNIGIIAHIDAGKTTTTERMLYYSGFTRRIGDVDEGSTVMDYLPAERARGITITSACITFPWHSYTINLIDTPGHADFTFEVERSIRVLDGAVTILDGVAGVEAQTEQVWRQAARYGIPRIAYVNKLDRMGAGFGKTVKEVGMKLGGWPAVVQIPIYETDAQSEELFKGVVDVVDKRVFRWGDAGGDGRNVAVHDYPWLQENMPKLYEEAVKARTALVEVLAEFDERIVDLYLELGNHQLIEAADIRRSLRALTIYGDGKVIPIFCGASFRNMGVQPLLDGVVDYLPSPQDKALVTVSYFGGKERALLVISEERMCALAFKVVNDPKRGMMVFVRVYSGTLNRAATVLNTNLQTTEKVQRLLRMYADEAVDIGSIPTGHIGVVLGLKHTRTGDTLIINPPPPKGPGQNKKAHGEKAMRDSSLQLRPITVPPPVFFASLEPNTLSEQKHLEEALQILLREDPSLHVSIDQDSGQTLLSGMGELHLEIARDRLVNDLKAKADMGRILIGYRETITAPLGPVMRKTYDRDIGGKKLKAAITASVGSVENYNSTKSIRNPNEVVQLDSENTLTIHILEHINPDTLPATLSVPMPCQPGSEDQHIPPLLQPYSTVLRNALISGTVAALSRGPYLGFPCHSTHVHLVLNPNTDVTPNESNSAAITSATRLAVSAVLKAAFESPSSPSLSDKVSLMEPVMDVTILVPESDLGTVVSDLSGSRGGNVYSLDDDPSPSTTTTSPSSSSPSQDDDDGQDDRFDSPPPIQPHRIYAPPDTLTSDTCSSASGSDLIPRTIKARVPLKEMVGYLKHLRSLTKGRGSFVMAVDRFEKMPAPRAKVVVAEMRGEAVAKRY